jgi:hypothetical protein
VGVWELLAVTTTTTSTTTSTTTTTLITTTTAVQAAGGQSGNSVSDVWVPLLAALLGAIVGGLLALAGSVLVNRWELRRTARFRMYEELLPRVKNETWPRLRWRRADRDLFEQSLDALERAGAIAGPLEWRDAAIVRLNGKIYADLRYSTAYTEDQRQEQARKLGSLADEIDDDIRKLDKLLQQHVRRLWPRWRQRLRLHRRKRPADGS